MAKILLDNLSLEFPIYDVSSRSIKKNFMRAVTGGRVMTDVNHRFIIKALNNMTVNIEHGDRIGLIGHNGAGKSSLLRLLAGIYEPTHGELEIQGHVSSLLNFTQGIEEELTGLENIHLRGTIMGLSRRQIREQQQEIAQLTGLGDYLNMPTRTYSSGMKVRLSFAISSSIQPEILLIDEVFGAGDADFMGKARKRIIALLDQSSIVVMANHNNNLLQEFCNKALILESGSIRFFGPIEEALG